MALAVQQRRITALAHVEGLDLICELSLQVFRRCGAGCQQLAAHGVVEQPALLPQLAVLGVELHGGGICHEPIVGARASSFRCPAMVANFETSKSDLDVSKSVLPTHEDWDR